MIPLDRWGGGIPRLSGFPKNGWQNVKLNNRGYEDTTRVMSRLKAVYRSQTIGCAGKKPHGGRHRAEWLGQLRRFRSKRQFWAYCGLALETRSSADYRFVNGQRERASRSHRQPASRERAARFIALRVSLLTVLGGGRVLHASDIRPDCRLVGSRSW